MQHLVLYKVCSYCNIHEFAWTNILVASASPIHVHVLKHCGVHKTYNIYLHVIQNNLRTPQLAGFGHKNYHIKMIVVHSTLVQSMSLTS